MQVLVVDPLESGYLDVLEIRRARRKPVDVEERRVEYPIAIRRTVNVWAAVLVRAVVVMRVIEIDQRSAVVEPCTAPILKEPEEIVYTTVHPRIVTPLVRRRV